MVDNDEPVSQVENDLAYMCWNTPDNWERTAGAAPYVPELYNIIVGGDSNFTNGGDWLFRIRQLYDANGGSAIKPLLTKVVGRGRYTVDNFRNFSWDTVVNESSSYTAQQQVIWSFTGYITMLITKRNCCAV